MWFAILIGILAGILLFVQAHGGRRLLAAAGIIGRLGKRVNVSFARVCDVQRQLEDISLA